jgi:hypothetical protein
MTSNLAIVEDDLVGQVFSAVDRGLEVSGRGIESEIDLGNFRPDPKAPRFSSKESEECLREDVLSRMLLHHFTAVKRINGRLHLFANRHGSIAFDEMADGAIFIDLNIDYI